METLTPHPAHPPRQVRSVTARVLSHDTRWCVLRWRVEGTRDLVIPPFAGRARSDGLWQATCFELFVRPVLPAFHHNPATSACKPDSAHPEPVEGGARHLELGAGVTRILRQAQDERGGESGDTQARAGENASYTEFNFAPSERWAAYDFTAYRTGMAQRPAARAPVITPRRGSDVLICDVAIPADMLPARPWNYGLTAVLEEAGGTKSYWAMAHAKDHPDFHDPACHAGWLAAPTTP